MPQTKSTHFNIRPFLSQNERRHQTEMIMKLFEFWKLTCKQQVITLGLAPDAESSIDKYKTGKAFLPQQRDIQDRVRLIFVIHKYLRHIYPHNKELAYQWISSLNQDFNNLSPLDIITRDGFIGLVKIQNYLELQLTIATMSR